MDPKICVLCRKCVNLGSLRSLNCFIQFLLKACVFVPECWKNIEPAEDFVDTDRQGDSLNDNIPAVFAATLGASLLANVLFGGGGQAASSLKKIGHLLFNFIFIIILGRFIKYLL